MLDHHGRVSSSSSSGIYSYSSGSSFSRRDGADEDPAASRMMMSVMHRTGGL
jgi:hypothetical protein